MARTLPDLASAHPYAGDPRSLANLVYANGLGNGDFASGDGWAFRGRGILQITGRSNYREVGKNLGLDLESQPDLLAQPQAATLPAAFFWKSKGLNELADQQTDQSFEKNHIDYQWWNDRVRRPQEVLANREKNTLWRVID